MSLMVNTPDNIFGKLKSSRSLPSPPQVLLKLIDACNSYHTSPTELADIVFKDPSISTKVLQLINSSYLGMRDKIDDLEKAVIYLGADTLKNIAVSASVFQVFGSAKGNSSFHMEHFWWHSLMCATLAKKIAREVDYPSVDEAFLSGLLHDIGKLILWVNFNKEYSIAIEDAGGKTELLTAKEKIIGATHYELGAWLVEQWHLNSFMADAIRYHHDRMERIVDALPLVKIIYVANTCCYATEPDDERAKEVAGAVFNLSSEQITKILSHAKDEVSDMAKSLGIPANPPEQANKETISAYKIKEEKLISEVKYFSLLYGTVQNLLTAKNKHDILETLNRGFQILFGIRQFLFFLYETEKKQLKGHAFPENSFDGLANMLVIPCKGHNSQMIQALMKNQPFNSITTSGAQPLSILDEQILRLLGTKGMWYMPMSANQEPVGLIAVGTSEHQSRALTKQKKLLRLFANHAGMCLYLEKLKQAQTHLIQEERLKASATIARKVVHEVNNPLGIIKNYLRILGLKLPEKHPAQDELGIISEEIDRVGQIISYLRDVTKPQVRSFEPIDINLLLTNILNITKNSILQPAKIELHFKPDSNIPKIQSEKNGLKQIIINLIKNAVEAMPRGGNIYVTTKLIGTTDIYTTNIKSSSDMIEVTIQDDGPGISEKIKDRLFEPFISSKKDGHSGLGLSIVHNIVRELHGSIQCHSTPGSGTAFIVTLPTTLPENKKGLED